MVVALSAFVCFGQFVFALGVTSRSGAVMLLGRVLFGLGGESVGVAQACVTTKWFKQKELAFALGLNLAVPRLGSVLNATLTPILAVHFGVPASVWMSLVTCILSFFACCALYVVERKCEQIPAEGGEENGNSQFRPLLQDETNSAFNLLQRDGDDCDTLMDESWDLNSKFVPRGVTPAESASSRKQPPSPKPLVAATFKSTSNLSTRPHHSNSKPSSGLQLGSLLWFPVEFWLLCVVCVFVYGTIVPFNNMISAFLQEKWYHGDPIVAGNVMGLPDIVGAVLVPFCGFWIDRFGHRASVLLVCCLLMATTHATLGFSRADENISKFWNPVCPMMLLGVAYSFFGVVLWSSIACLFHSFVPYDPLMDTIPRHPLNLSTETSQANLLLPSIPESEIVSPRNTSASLSKPFISVTASRQSPSLTGLFRSPFKEDNASKRSEENSAFDGSDFAISSVSKNPMIDAETLNETTNPSDTFTPRSGSSELIRDLSIYQSFPGVFHAARSSLGTFPGTSDKLALDVSQNTLRHHRISLYSPIPSSFTSALPRRVSSSNLPLLAASNSLPRHLLRQSSILSISHSPQSQNFHHASPAHSSASSMHSQESASLSDFNSSMSDPLAIAYGTATASMNLALTVVPLLTASIKSLYAGSAPHSLDMYVALEVFFVAESLAAAMVSLVILLFDLKHGETLEGHASPAASNDVDDSRP